MFRLQ